MPNVRFSVVRARGGRCAETAPEGVRSVSARSEQAGLAAYCSARIGIGIGGVGVGSGVGMGIPGVLEVTPEARTEAYQLVPARACAS